VQPVSGRVALAWGDAWADSQPLEHDLAESELEEQVGTAGEWTRIYRGPLTRYVDARRPYDSLGTIPVHFRARVKDSSAQYSAWSNTVTVKALAQVAVRQEEVSPWPVGLDPAYPNPFNGISNFGFRTSEWSRVRLRIVDLLGRETRALINGEYARGRYSVQWDGRDTHGHPVASGVYLVRLEVGERVFIRKILFVR
jgi:hypothetical protein